MSFEQMGITSVNQVAVIAATGESDFTSGRQVFSDCDNCALSLIDFP
jgi:hypothetical protein